MPSFAYWMAVALVRRRTAPLEAWYCGLELSVPTRPSWDEMLTMEPPPARRMAGMTARVPRKTPVELTAMIRSQSARVVSSIRLPPPMPALLTRTSSFPYKRSASVTAPAQSDSLVTSRRTNVAPPRAAADQRDFPFESHVPSPVCVSGLLVDGFRQEEDVLRPLEIALVELADQLLPRRRGEVFLILLGVANLDPLDVVPARILGPVNGALDPVRGVARDARQTLGHLVVVLAHPLLVGRGIHPLLQRRDHVPHFHRRLPHPPATGSKQSSRSPSCRTRSFSQAVPFTATSHVSASAPSAVSRAAIVIAGATSMVVRSRPSGRNRRRLPCMCTVTLIRAPRAPAA